MLKCDATWDEVCLTYQFRGGRRRIHARPGKGDEIRSPDWKNFQSPGFVASADVECAFRSTSKITDDWQVTPSPNRVGVSEEKIAIPA